MMAVTGSLCFLLGLTTAASSQPTELTIYRQPKTLLVDDHVNIPFAAQAVVGKCNDANRVCGRISGHKEKFTIPAGTKIQPNTDLISVMDDEGSGEMIVVNDHKLPGGEKPLGQLTVKGDTVEEDGVFTAPFLITEIHPNITYRTDKKETVISLNGPMENQPVDIQFAANRNGNGDKFKLTVYPSTAAIKQFCLAPLFVVSAMLLT
ncbi:hypothetical protein SprV_0602137400 [Sparganum proliferum]